MRSATFPSITLVLMLGALSSLPVGVAGAQTPQPEPTPQPAVEPAASPAPPAAAPQPAPPGASTPPSTSAAPSIAPSPSTAPASNPAAAPVAKGKAKPVAARPLDSAALADKLTRNPDEPALLNEYGNQLIRSGKLRDAIIQYRKAVDLAPGMAPAWNNLGVAYMGLGQIGKAESSFRKALKIDDTYALAWYNLGALYEKEGSFKKAVDTYEKAIRLDRSLADIRVNPHVASTRLLPAAIVQDYIDRGSTYLPAVDSSYPVQKKKRPS